MIYTTWNGTKWERVDPGHYIRDGGAEIIKTGAATWTLSHPYLFEDTRHRSLRKAMLYADTL